MLFASVMALINVITDLSDSYFSPLKWAYLAWFYQIVIIALELIIEEHSSNFTRLKLDHKLPSLCSCLSLDIEH
ncbi:hypothetical protein GCM10009114_21530 [Aliiglaciecola litoralis]|uniref:Uncharacterized protein n=1 Tax=Aliiglaciecola litoralis TaxID=582857 RepID=A0ABN1LK40_9ALTE